MYIFGDIKDEEEWEDEKGYKDIRREERRRMSKRVYYIKANYIHLTFCSTALEFPP